MSQDAICTIIHVSIFCSFCAALLPLQISINSFHSPQRIRLLRQASGQVCERHWCVKSGRTVASQVIVNVVWKLKACFSDLATIITHGLLANWYRFKKKLGLVAKSVQGLLKKQPTWSSLRTWTSEFAERQREPCRKCLQPGCMICWQWPQYHIKNMSTRPLHSALPLGSSNQVWPSCFSTVKKTSFASYRWNSVLRIWITNAWTYGFNFAETKKEDSKCGKYGNIMRTEGPAEAPTQARSTVFP